MIKNKTLKELRLETKLSHQEVAINTGITRVFYTQIENGNRTPSLNVAKCLSDTLKITLDEFYEALEVTKCNEGVSGVK